MNSSTEQRLKRALVRLERLSQANGEAQLKRASRPLVDKMIQLEADLQGVGNLTQEEWGHVWGVSPNTVNSWANGKRGISEARLAAFYKRYRKAGLKAEEIIKDIDEAYRQKKK